MLTIDDKIQSIIIHIGNKQYLDLCKFIDDFANIEADVNKIKLDSMEYIRLLANTQERMINIAYSKVIKYPNEKEWKVSDFNQESLIKLIKHKNESKR